MNKLFLYIFIVFGIAVIVASFLLGGNRIEVGCGSCGSDTVRLAPRLLITGLPSTQKPSPEICALAGCSQPVMPVFVDGYLLGFGLIGFGAYSLKKRRRVK
ncbi:MAG: hypothetical protein HY435_01590 [Candidatus Liptonbacteria bacterium]|nr:hypothetical protein [Candidatus Liptonbacteria bacterium]